MQIAHQDTPAPPVDEPLVAARAHGAELERIAAQVVVSDEIAEAYRRWRFLNAIAYGDTFHDMQEEEAEDSEDGKALSFFAVALSAVAYKAWDAFHRTPSIGLADTMVKLRAQLEEDEGAFDTIRIESIAELKSLVEAIHSPAAMAWKPEGASVTASTAGGALTLTIATPDGARPATDAELRAHLHENPCDVLVTAPADILRIFTPAEGREALALLASYGIATASTSDPDANLPGRAREALRAYGLVHSAFDTRRFLGAERDQFFPGELLTDQECAALAATGVLPLTASARLASMAEAERESAASEKAEEREGESSKTERDAERVAAMEELFKGVPAERRRAAQRVIAWFRLSDAFDIEWDALFEQAAETLMEAIAEHPKLAAAASGMTAERLDRLRATLAHWHHPDTRIQRLCRVLGEADRVYDALDGEQIASDCERMEGALNHMAASAEAAALGIMTLPPEHLRDVAWQMALAAGHFDDAFDNMVSGIAEGKTNPEWPKYLRAVQRVIRGSVLILRDASGIKPEETGLAHHFRWLEPKEGRHLADTIAAFEAEQPGMLAMPFVPTQVMEHAAVALAGITPEQFRYAYAAALEASQKEKAA